MVPKMLPATTSKSFLDGSRDKQLKTRTKKVSWGSKENDFTLKTLIVSIL